MMLARRRERVDSSKEVVVRRDVLSRSVPMRADTFDGMMTRAKRTTTSGKEMTSTGKEMTSTGKEMTFTGKEMTSTGKEIIFPGREITCSDKRMTARDRATTRAGEVEVGRGRLRTLSGRGMTSPGREMTSSGREMTSSGREMTSSGRETIPSGRETIPSGRETIPSGRETTSSDGKWFPHADARVSSVDLRHAAKRSEHITGVPSQQAHPSGFIEPVLGSANVKVAPSPSSLSALIQPPCRRTIRWTSASPTPVPSNSLAEWSL